MDDAFQQVEPGNEEVLEVKSLQIFKGLGFPEVRAAGILRGGNEDQLDSGAVAEDAVAGYLEDSPALFQNPLFLAASIEERDDVIRIQQEPQTVCPLKETGFLAGNGCS